jgi:hypothetical protein
MTMTNEMPATNNAVDLLAERYRAAFDKTDLVRKRSEVVRTEWIEATLELAEIVVQATQRYPDTNEFSRWLARNDLPMTTPAERSALRGLARDPEAGRKMLQASTSYKVRSIWEKAPKGEKRTPSEMGRGTKNAIRRGSHLSGHAQRQSKRAPRIPDVMQDKPRPLEAVHIKGLTREEVDPDFKGTDLQFATKYGHVTLHTKAQIEQDKRAAAAAKWVGEVTAHARTADAITARPEGVAEWLAKPGKAARLKGLLDSIRRAAERLEPEEQIATNPDLLDECPRLN